MKPCRWRDLSPLPNNEETHQLYGRVLFAIAFLLAVGMANPATAQEKKNILRDTLDNKFDFSQFVLNAHGFIPVLMIITEPALGNIGVAAAPMFLKSKPVSPEYGYVPPDITMPIAAYTGNKSWMVGGVRIATIPKSGIKYRVGAMYGRLNLDFYQTVDGIDYPSTYELKSFTAFGMVSKRINKKNMYVGLSYQFLNTDATLKDAEQNPNDDHDKNKAGTLGILFNWDRRNSIFTPDRGFRLNVKYGINDNWTGSDFSFTRINASLISFFPFKPNWVGGFRAEVQHAFDPPPFYLTPGIDMRGIPAARYQGLTTMLIETEQRYDFTLRWSGVAFAGVGKALPEDISFSDAETVYSVGGGFRYLLARLFNIRAGIDVAWGPDSFGYYIVFGQNWSR